MGFQQHIRDLDYGEEDEAISSLLISEISNNVFVSMAGAAQLSAAAAGSPTNEASSVPAALLSSSVMN